MHHYTQRAAKLEEVLANPHRKYVDGRRGQPWLVAEYGGVASDVGGPFGKNPKKFLVGYNGAPGFPKTRKEALRRIQSLTSSIYQNPSVAGFCYTQLYDVEYEKNGLLRYDRSAKFPGSALVKTFGGEE